MTDDRKKTHLIVTGRGGGSGEQVQANWSQTDSEQPDYIKNKPELATVATSGSYNDLTDKPTIPTQAQADWNETDTADPSYIQNKPTIPAAQVNADWNAVSGVAQILNKPSIPAAQIQSDWNQSDNTQADYIKNKPVILTQWFGTQAEYDLIDPKDPNVIYNIEGSDNVQADWNQSDSSADDYIKNKPTIPTVNNATLTIKQGGTTKGTFTANAGSDVEIDLDAGGGGGTQVQSDWNQTDNTQVDYIKNKPTIPAAQVNSDWNASTGVSQILNKPTLATVATTGDYTDLTNKPTIPAAQVNSDWNSNSGVSQILNKPSLATVATSGNYSDLNGTPTLATVATSGDYDDLQNKPTIPAAQVQSDWNEANSSSLAYIANKPTIPAAQVNSDWNAVSGVAQILNKPTIPVLPPMTTETLTFTLQGGTTKTVDFYVVPNYFYVEDISGSDNTLTIKATDYGLPTITVYKSTDQKNWTSMGNIERNGITATVPANGRLYLKANVDSLHSGYANTNITCSGNFNIGGYIMSLLYGDNFVQTSFQSGSSDNFKGLFTNSTTLINASDLVLSATTLTEYCYTTMFSGCTSLTTAPALPATTLATNCYENMFGDCTALTTAPVLPAVTLEYKCYWGMFMNCTNINKIVCYANGTRDTYHTGNWLSGVSATGDFYKLGNYNFNTGASGIPSGWTVHTSL